MVRLVCFAGGEVKASSTCIENHFKKLSEIFKSQNTSLTSPKVITY